MKCLFTTALSSILRTMKVQIIFYSMYGHIYKMAEAIAEGARQVPGLM